MALVAHFDLELYQMDVKTSFLNGSIEEKNLYGESFIIFGLQIKKFIYGVKQASRQWYLKFDQVISDFDVKENIVNQCIYHKFKGSKFIFLVLYMDDILLASNDIDLLLETKIFS